MDHLIPMPLDHAPGAILFDCDGTLCDTMPLHYRAWRRILDAAGHPDLFPEPQFYAWGGVCASEILERLNRDHGTEMNVAELTHAKEMAYRELIPELTGIEPVLAEVRRFHGVVPLAVVSGGMGLVVRESLRILGIEDRFDTIVGSEDSPRSKPAPDPFLIAAQRLGVAPERCVVFEDAPAGLEGARLAGMKAVDITRHIGRNSLRRVQFDSGGPWEARVGYCRAVRVGDRVVVAGTTSTAPDGTVLGIGDAHAQTATILRCIESALAAVGAGMGDVVRSRMYVVRRSDVDAVGRAHAEVFGDVRPAATLVLVAGLIHPDHLVEIEVEAVVGTEPTRWTGALP